MNEYFNGGFMLSSSFYESGSVLTMGDFKTYAADISNDKTSSPEAYAIVPEFSLQHLEKKWTISHLKELKPEIQNTAKPDLLSELKSTNWSADLENYHRRYTEIKKLISSGEIKKAVPFLTYKISKPKDFNQRYLPQLINHLMNNKPESEYIYGFWNTSKGFLGCTPEFLIQKLNLKPTEKQEKKLNSKDAIHPKNLAEKIQTMALAGTLPASNSSNMLADLKLKEEHRFVMDDISEKLANLILEWSTPKEKVFGLVKHIHATADFDDVTSIENLIQKLSPTSALGVYPKEKLKDLKDLLAIDTRGSYGAPFGYVFRDQFNIIVALRGLFWDDKTISIHVGGGVTDKSEYQTELDELNLKFLSTKKKLGL